MSVLDEIIAGVRLETAARMAAVPMAEVQALAESRPPAIDVLSLLRAPGVHVIAEVKRSSPSKGHLADIPSPAALARDYAAGGATAISVLTEERRFNGSLADLDEVRAAVPTAILRKDFIVEPYQVWEARAHGADLVLLIVAGLPAADLASLAALIKQLGMTPLVEVHDRDEVAAAVAAGAEVIGVNNRDLRTLAVNPDQFMEILPAIPAGLVKVAESGIRDAADVARYAAAGADAVLVGEALVTGGNPRQAVADFIAAGTAARGR